MKSKSVSVIFAGYVNAANTIEAAARNTPTESFDMPEPSSLPLRAISIFRKRKSATPKKSRSARTPRIPDVTSTVETHENPWGNRLFQNAVWLMEGSLYISHAKGNVPG